MTYDIVLGNKDDLTRYANRLQIMLPQGNKISAHEAMALAQIAIVTGLNPFTGELWYIPGKGPMVGIAGARKLAQQDAKGKGGYVWEEFTDVPPDEAGVPPEVKDLVAAVKCVVYDSAAIEHFQKSFLEMVTAFREAGSKDPVGEARSILGNKPQWEGYGFSTKSERSTMNKRALAKKRAHADALKKKIIVPFGGGTVSIAPTDVAPGFDAEGEVVEDVDSEDIDMLYPPDVVEGETTEQPKSKAVPRPEPKQSKKETEKPTGPVGKVLDILGDGNTHHAAWLVNNLGIDSSTTDEKISEKLNQYEDLKSSGKTKVEAAAIVKGK